MFLLKAYPGGKVESMSCNSAASSWIFYELPRGSVADSHKILQECWSAYLAILCLAVILPSTNSCTRALNMRSPVVTKKF